ncbi:lecithin retinol acyltransferase family protein [Shewanella alkalitolerans]|uniref:lecithin retinol acyltransferase family protein n=1 Tax=Shewanella alkalitolerans TaxID=2864209 RepID=UPI001C658209|nr:lecithin retinol acyltransferase family protein [Shewanella alkalitolerans]QYJ96308.1 lecithin retinol acyltransferase family protein [Shewanella alkalitolerans]
MALPLLWLGGAALGAAFIADAKQKQRQLTLDRRLGRAPKAPEGKRVSPLAPSVLHLGEVKVTPPPGALVCCFVFGVIEHTGIWLGDDTLVELHGSGLIRPVSSKRFLAGRTGSRIFVACDHQHRPLIGESVLKRAQQAIYQYRDYDLFDNNCHRFVWYCLTGEELSISSFDKFNRLLASHFAQAIYWDEAAIAKRD